MAHDVVIAGGGPVGLFLACELGLAGISVLVLERAEDPRSPLKRLPFGMRGLTVPTIEAFDRRGLLDEIAAPQPGRPLPREAGHFAGIDFDYADIDTAKWTYRLPSPADTNRAGEMERIETVLADRARQLHVEIKRGVAVERIEHTDEGVTVHAGAQTFRAQWLVGCDGGRSTVRKLSGFEFAGTDPEFTGYSTIVDIADPEKLRPGRNVTSTGVYFMPQPGYLAMAEFDGGAFHRSELTREHIEAVLRRVSNTDVTVAAFHAGASWTDRAQQVSTYRKGRVLLAGDAAHIHSPLGGQGLNLGLGDAMNLGWKLAATIKGFSAEGLLDTYTAERHPIGASVLDWSRAQVALMKPTPQARALEAIMRDLMHTRDGATYFAERVWNVSLRYDFGNNHSLVGRSAPDFQLQDGARLATLMREGRAVFLDFDRGAYVRRLASVFGERVHFVAGEPKNRLGLNAVLVRPDGIVAWVAEGELDIAGAEKALRRWFV